MTFEEKLNEVKSSIVKKQCNINESNDRKTSEFYVDSDKMLIRVTDIEMGKQFRYRIKILNDLRAYSIELDSPFFNGTLSYSGGFKNRMKVEMTPEQYNEFLEVLVCKCKQDYVETIKIIGSVHLDVEDDISKVL